MNKQFTPEAEAPMPFNTVVTPDDTSAPSASVFDNTVSSSLGVAAGYLIKRVVVRKSASLFRKIVGYVFQAVVAQVISRNPSAVKASIKYLVTHIHKKKGVLNSHDR